MKKRILKPKKGAAKSGSKKAPAKKKLQAKATPRLVKVDESIETLPSEEIHPLTGAPYSQEFVAGRFKPGQSGNPGGRPRGRKSVKAWIDEILDEELVDTKTGRVMTKGEVFARRVVHGAIGLHPDPQLREILASREYPKPSTLDLTLSQGEHDPEAREVVQALDAEGRKALREVVQQLGGRSELDDSPAKADESVH